MVGRDEFGHELEHFVSLTDAHSFMFPGAENELMPTKLLGFSFCLGEDKWCPGMKRRGKRERKSIGVLEKRKCK